MTSIYESRKCYRGTGLMANLVSQDLGRFEHCCRISSDHKKLLNNKIREKIGKQNSNFRKPIFITTLLFLATGDS